MFAGIAKEHVILFCSIKGRKKYMAIYSLALEYLLRNEGALEENQKDPGGITNMGISLRFLKAVIEPAKYGIHDQNIDADTIRHLTISQVNDLYKGEFWDHSNFANISDQDVCNYVFDAAVNMGIAPAVKCLQRAIWACWKNRSTVLDDGIMGANTLIWVERCKPDKILAALRSERAGTYRAIIAENSDQELFYSGWMKRAYESET
jgi:lysozyme family protein